MNQDQCWRKSYKSSWWHCYIMLLTKSVFVINDKIVMIGDADLLICTTVLESWMDWHVNTIINIDIYGIFLFMIVKLQKSDSSRNLMTSHWVNRFRQTMSLYPSSDSFLECTSYRWNLCGFFRLGLHERLLCKLDSRFSQSYYWLCLFLWIIDGSQQCGLMWDEPMFVLEDWNHS
jgi:hypothetical protein